MFLQAVKQVLNAV